MLIFCVCCAIGVKLGYNRMMVYCRQHRTVRPTIPFERVGVDELFTPPLSYDETINNCTTLTSVQQQQHIGVSGMYTN
jgi:hypothetical protein